MNNFEQNTNLSEMLSQVIHHLKIIAENGHSFSAIEKDILLQNLRDAYLIVLQTEPAENVCRSCEECAGGEEISPAEIPMPEKAVEPETPQKADTPEKTAPAESAQAPAPPEPTVKSEPARPEEINPEVSTLFNEDADILDFLSTKISDNSEEDAAFEASLDAQSAPFARVVTEKQAGETKDSKNATPISQPTSASQSQLVFPKGQEQKPAPKRSLNDLLTQQIEDNSLGTKFQHAKVEDLSKAISLNDKFLFIKELFRNKGEEFSTAIQKLNRCTDIDEAFQEIDNLKRYYLWDTTGAAFLSLCDLVRRKFL